MANKANPQKQYPWLAGITDINTKESIRLLWDAVHNHADQLNSISSTVTSVNTSVTSLQTSTTNLSKTVTQIAGGSGTSQSSTVFGTGRGVSNPNSGNPSGGSGTGGGSTGGGGNTDNGAGALGCSEAGSTGHLTAPFPINPESAGQIICGVGNEFPALLAIAANQPARDANQDELLNRMVWHLNLQGFPCSRYPTTNGRPWLLLFNCGSTQFAYRVVDYSAGDYTVPFTTTMVYGGQTANTTTTPDGGTPD